MSDREEIRREDFPYAIELAVRWADCDAYGHVNNVVYYSWFDTAVTRMLYERAVLSLRDSPAIGICVESGCRYFAPVTFPQQVEVRVRIGRMGRKSLRYEVAVFLPGEEAAVASGYFVHVFVDRATRKSVPLTEEARSAVHDLVVSDG